MNVGTLDRRSAFVLVGGIIAIAILRFGVYGDSQSQVVSAAESIPKAEQRLERVRQLAAMVPGKETVLKQANADLAAREAGLLTGDTAAQAQAQLLTIVQKVANNNQFSAPGVDTWNVKPLGSDYGEVSISVTFACAIEQLVNFLAEIANQPQALATSEISITGGTDKKKNLQVRLTISGVVRKALLPVKKAGSF